MSRLFPERRIVRLAPSGAGDVGAAPARVTVVLPGQFVRYLAVPWDDALEGEAEEQAYLRHHFARVHGERAKQWGFRWSHGLASAIDRALLEQLLANKNVVSIQPELMAAFNRSRGAIPRQGAWLVLVDGERACVALHARGRWLSVQQARMPWQELLERERVRAHSANPGAVVHLESVH